MKSSGHAAFRNVSAAILSQALASLTNFALNIFLLRTMLPEEFGLFGIGFALIMVLNGFWQGFFITQYIVLAPGEDCTRFPAQVYAAMVLVSVSAGLLLVVAAAALQVFAGLGVLVLGIGFSAIGFSFKEFHTRNAFRLGRGRRAIRINMLMATALAVFLGCALLVDLAPSAEFAFAVYALAVALAALLGHTLSGLSLSGHSRADIAETMSKLAAGGKWAIATNVIFSLRNNAHVIILATVIGPTAVALVNAARLFLTPPILLLPALANVILPHFSKAFHAGGRTALRLSQLRSGAMLLVVVLGYSAVLLLMWRSLAPLLVGDQYQGLAPMVAAWSAFASVLMLRSIIDWGAQAQSMFALIAIVSVGVAVIALAAAWLLTSALGPIGAVLALVLSELAMALALWTALARKI